MKITLTITMDFEEEPRIVDVRKYAKEALESWGGGKHSDDIFHPDNIRTVKIESVTKEK